MNTTKKTARIAGVLYLILAIGGIFSVFYVPSIIVVTGDPAATANNIASSEFLYRAGIASSLATHVLFVLLVLTLYRLFKEVDQSQAMVMVVMVVISVASGFVHTLSQVAALIVLNSPDILSVFEQPELDALAYFFLRFHGHGLNAMEVFWGLWLFPFGVLVYKSQFIPKIFGVLLFIAGFGYLLDSFTFFLWPEFRTSISTLIRVLTICELPIVFWLLIVGVKDQSGEQAVQPAS